MDIKWIAIGISIIVMSAMFALSVESYSEEKTAIENAKAGLEQCPNYRSMNSSATIWVRDCKEFTEAYQATR